MQLTLVTPPAVEPITLAEAKLHAKVDTSADDTLIGDLIVAARQYAEQYTQRAFINQTWRLTLDYYEFNFERRYIELDKGNIDSIASFNCYDSNNNVALFANTNYRLSGSRLVLDDKAEWPIFNRLYEAVSIDYVAGFGATAADVPQAIKQAILMLVDHYYINRLATSAPVNTLPFGVQALLQTYRIFSL